MEINLLLSYSSIHKKSYFVQKNRTWCRKGKISEGVCRYKKIKWMIHIKNLMMGSFGGLRRGEFRSADIVAAALPCGDVALRQKLRVRVLNCDYAYPEPLRLSAL